MSIFESDTLKLFCLSFPDIRTFSGLYYSEYYLNYVVECN